MPARKNEEKKVCFRTPRFIQEGSDWYYFRRGGAREGPFSNRGAAINHLEMQLQLEKSEFLTDNVRNLTVDFS